MTQRHAWRIVRYRSSQSVIYTHVIVREPARNGRNQSDFNLHILQMQKQVGRPARNGIFPRRHEIGQEKEKEREKGGKDERTKTIKFPCSVLTFLTSFRLLARSKYYKRNLISKFSNYVEKKTRLCLNFDTVPERLLAEKVPVVAPFDTPRDVSFGR